MFRKKINLAVGLTTFRTELLRISVPALSRLPHDFLLIIYNDNPAVTLTRHNIRKMGYRGALHIINGTENIDVMRGRMQIMTTLQATGHNPEWIIFVNDNDILVDIDIPDVSSDVFAVMQNALSVRHQIADLFVAIDNPDACVHDNDNIVMIRPNTGICGTPIRTSVMGGMMGVLGKVLPEMSKINEELNFRPNYDAIMWGLLNLYARHSNSGATPIYMDRQNYIMCDIDSSLLKYGRSSRSCIDKATARYMDVFSSALRGTD